MKKKFSNYIFLLFIGVVLTSCTKEFNEMNSDPTAVSGDKYDPNYMLTTSQLHYTGSPDFSAETWRTNIAYFSMMTQLLSSTVPYWIGDGDKYTTNESYTGAYFNSAYSMQVKPASDMVKLTENKEQYKNLHQIARIMRALIMQRITDIYGDVPYFDAGYGVYSANYFPKYDAQSAIYADLLKEIDEATNALDLNGDKPKGDLFYNGNIAQWKRLGSSLLLRVAMRLSKVDPAMAQQYVQKAIGKTMTGNSDNAMVIHEFSGGRATVNRNSQVLIQPQESVNIKFAQTFIDYLKSNNDPRLKVIAQLANGDMNPASQKGMPNGYNRQGNAQDITRAPNFTSMGAYSQVSRYLSKMDGPTFILTYAESELLLADAAARWNIGGSAEQHYNNGVRAAITFHGQYDAAAAISEAEANTYLAAHPYNAANGLQMINTQYWAHTGTMLDFYEAWSNWRRTGFPVLTPVNYPGNATNATIPRRLPYPIEEASTNPANYQTAHNSVPGGDTFMGRVWWDKP
jgi:hypothetical protein